ncbi:TetR/AcrR family transcriptional regulator [Azospirillum halopraeferens]|uniref:TetR/AcrR family transcriptional regulator n=1 Tax=Azospirillum halopraeferens TaxID=34010 RepID=UPI0004081B80|nr:TetR/AcrR family transcriptional regulator [Azospirillum halopraeferens]
MDEGDDLSGRIIDRAMALAAERGWRRTGMLEVARAAGVPAGELYRRFPDRPALLAGVSRRADAAVLAGGEPPPVGSGGGGAEEESPRDRLFDVMMRRFDALQPYRPGLAAVLRDLPREPLTALAFARQYARSMAWMLRAAGIDPDRPGGAVLVAGLCSVQARVMRVFVGDDSEDLSRTMAALDAELRRAESLAGTLCRGRRRASPAAPTPEPAAG